MTVRSVSVGWYWVIYLCLDILTSLRRAQQLGEWSTWAPASMAESDRLAGLTVTFESFVTAFTAYKVVPKKRDQAPSRSVDFKTIGRQAFMVDGPVPYERGY